MHFFTIRYKIPKSRACFLALLLISSMNSENLTVLSFVQVNYEALNIEYLKFSTFFINRNKSRLIAAMCSSVYRPGLLKFIYSEEATKFCEMSTVHLTVTTYVGQIYGGDFSNICGLLRIYELYLIEFCIIFYFLPFHQIVKFIFKFSPSLFVNALFLFSESRRLCFDLA